MRSLIAIALGLLILVSAAAATGNYNDVWVEVYSEAEDNCIVDATLAQVTDESAFVFGNYNYVAQDADLYANCNALTGFGWNYGFGEPEGPEISQIAIQVANTIGSYNDAFQFAETSAFDNCLVNGGLDQSITELAEEFGNNNQVNQCIDLYTDYNSITDGALIQQGTALVKQHHPKEL
jgi:hypothetical protein